MYQTPPRGFIGLMMLLIGVALIGFLVWRSDLFSPKPSPAAEGAAQPLQGSNQIERGRSAVDAANEARQRIESSNLQMQLELE